MAGEIEIAVDNELMCGGNYLLRRIVSYVRLVGDVEILPRFSMGVVVRWRGFAKLAILFQLICYDDKRACEKNIKLHALLVQPK